MKPIAQAIIVRAPAQLLGLIPPHGGKLVFRLNLTRSGSGNGRQENQA